MSTFVLDPFQRRAIDAVDRGESVLVAAPTGAGKTVVAEHAVRRALADGDKAFYTTPIKALSNQKYHDLVAEHGEEQVGLLTGDRSVNGEAPVVVMTTEVLRNMLYARSRTLDGLRWVVLDEVHYLRDRARGPVWEEVIIHAPPAVAMVALSATVSNVDEIADWFRLVRGPTTLVTAEQRPVALSHYEMVTLGRGAPRMVPLFVDGAPNPEGGRFDPGRRSDERSGNRRRRDRRHRGEARDAPRPRPPRRRDVVRSLAGADLLPAIYFLFSRAGCDEAAHTVADADLGLTTVDEQHEIAAVATTHLEGLSAEERRVLDAAGFQRTLQAGVAPHHAGLVPAFKELVEACFLRGLVKVVFATETLALGINMPARTVVIERLTKFTGEGHEMLTPLEYTQLTGRAGRRGLDTAGTAVVLWSPWVRFAEVAALASSTDFPLESAFRPTYNMAANLVAGHDRDEAARLLRLSLAQFQLDRSVTDLERRRRDLTRRVDDATQAAVCELGDVGSALRRRAGSGAGAGAIRGALSRLRPGEVIAAPDGEAVAVISVAHRRNGAIRVRAVDARGHDRTHDLDEFTEAPDLLGAVSLPEPFDPASARLRRDVADALQRADIAVDGRGAGAEGPRSCPDFERHRDAWESLPRLRKRLGRVDKRLHEQAQGIDRRFADLCTVLTDRGCLDGWALTDKGELLRAIFHDLDLLVVEALWAGLFDDLDAPNLAALASCITFQPRSDERSPRRRVATVELRERIDRLDDLAGELMADERGAGFSATRLPDEGFVSVAHRWADGATLSVVVDEDLTGGDFVRQMRQLLDVLRQIGLAAPSPVTAAVARQAAGAIDRGVVGAEPL